MSYKRYNCFVMILYNISPEQCHSGSHGSKFCLISYLVYSKILITENLHNYQLNLTEMCI